MSDPTQVRPHHILCSFHYFRNIDLGQLAREKFKFPVRIFGDSGAYSALTKKLSIHPDEYVEWLKVNAPHLVCYANLDVIGDVEGTWKNQKHLEARGLQPVPVFHTGEPWSYLERYMAEYPLVALGGAVGYKAKVLMPWFIECFKRRRAAGLEQSVAFHGFGVTQQVAIRSLPWYSIDSSSWNEPCRYGRLRLFDPTRNGFRGARLFNKRHIRQVEHLIRLYGVDPVVFMDRAKYHHSHAAAASAMSWRALEKYLRRRHGAVPFPGSDEVGPNIFQAVNPTDVLHQRGEAVWSALRADAGPHLFMADGSSHVQTHANAHLAKVSSQG